MGRPRQKTDDEILEAARQCFLEGGSGVSTRLIAERAGMSQPALFKRFGSKEALFLAALAPPELFPELELIDASPGKGPFEPQLVAVMGHVWHAFSWIVPRIILIHQSQIRPEVLFSRYQTPPPVRMLMALSGFVQRAIALGYIRSDASPAVVANGIIGPLHARAFFSIFQGPTPEMSDEAYLKIAAANLYRGIAREESR